MDGDGSNTTNMTCHFLKILPTELRLEVYGYLLQPASLSIVSYRDHGGIPQSVLTAQTTPLFGKACDKVLHPEILRVCSQVHQEAKSILYQPSTIHLNPARHSSRSSASPSLDNLQLAALREINHLRLVVKGNRQEMAHATLLCSIFKNLKADTLSLRVVGKTLPAYLLRPVTLYLSAVIVKRLFTFCLTGRGTCWIKSEDAREETLQDDAWQDSQRLEGVIKNIGFWDGNNISASEKLSPGDIARQVMRLVVFDHTK